MSSNVPIWDLDVPLLDDYEMAELTWENGGELRLHALGLPRVSSKPGLSSSTGDAWDMPRADVGTLESIVNLATHHQKQPPPSKDCGGSAVAAAAATDAVVPCEGSTDEGISTGVEGSVAKKARLEARVPALEGENRSASVSVSFGGGDSWQVVTTSMDTCTEKEESGGFRLPTTSFLPDKLSHPQPQICSAF